MVEYAKKNELDNWGNNVMVVWSRMEEKINNMEDKVNNIDKQLAKETIRQTENNRQISEYIKQHNNIHRDLIDNAKDTRKRLKKVEQIQYNSSYWREIGKNVLTAVILMVVVFAFYIILDKSTELKGLL